MKYSKRRIVVFSVTLVLATIGGAIAYQNSHPGTSKTQGVGHASATPERDFTLDPSGSELVVRAFTIDASDEGRGASHGFTGTLQPRYQAAVGFRVAGKLSERLVEVGQRVRKGQTLFRLDPEDLDLQWRVAESDQISAQSLLKQASAEERRLAQLRSTGSVSQSEYDLGLATRDVAKARVDASDRRLALATNQRTYCDLVADEDGLITSIQAETGQVVNVGQPVLQMMKTDELEAIVSLPENIVAAVKGLQPRATFWSHPGLVLRAELRELSPMADPMSRTYDARFRLLESAPDLAIGMTVSIRLYQPEGSGIVVPLTSIASRDSQPIVWRIQSDTGRVEAVAIELVQYRNDSVVVHGSLQSGDRIVSAGVQRIDEKSTVRVWESKQAKAIHHE